MWNFINNNGLVIFAGCGILFLLSLFITDIVYSSKKDWFSIYVNGVIISIAIVTIVFSMCVAKNNGLW